ncbi:unnamed protein product [Pleuronectes platessa]|uniref:Uncharacterized protein n=1 Tax=Pleuronectes platessa TaxID=8262 RepID=A0A9N7VNJ9_PLEPL|nr:unnamed protein product [Pleuronectes platessa]
MPAAGELRCADAAIEIRKKLNLSAGPDGREEDGTRECRVPTVAIRHLPYSAGTRIGAGTTAGRRLCGISQKLEFNTPRQRNEVARNGSRCHVNASDLSREPVRRPDIAVFRAMVRVKFSRTFDFLGRDAVATDTAIGPCFVAIAHARLSEIGSKRDGSLYSYFHQHLR